MGVDKSLQILACFTQLAGEVSEALEATRPLGIWLTRITQIDSPPAETAWLVSQHSKPQIVQDFQPEFSCRRSTQPVRMQVP